MSTTRAQLVNRIAQRVNQWDGAAFIEGILTADMVNTALQDWYDRIFMHLAKHFPQDFEKILQLDFGPTYDDADETGKYNIETLLPSGYGLLWVGVKYATADTEYVRCEPVIYGEAYPTGSESFSEAAPRYLMSTLMETTSKYKAIEILPHNVTTDVTDGLQVRFIERPAALSGTVGVSSAIPEPYHFVIAEGALIDCYDILGGDYAKKIGAQEVKVERLKNEIVANYLPTYLDKPNRTKQDRRIDLLQRRII